MHISVDGGDRLKEQLNRLPRDVADLSERLAALAARETAQNEAHARAAQAVRERNRQPSPGSKSGRDVRR